jgi:hypothetical protein
MLPIHLALSACVMISVSSGSAQQLKVDKAEVAERLHRVASDEQLRRNDPDLVLKAIKAAGQCQVGQAVPDLIELLAFRYWYDWEKTKERPIEVRARDLIGVATRYPATEALAQIGKSALPQLLQVVETHPFASLESKNARYTVRLIFRDDQKADECFTNAAGTASSPEAKQRLLKAVQTADEDRRLNPEDRRPPATSP